jgi:hypothetical protein
MDHYYHLPLSEKTTAHRSGYQSAPHSLLSLRSRDKKVVLSFLVPHAGGTTGFDVEIDPQDFAALADCMVFANRDAALSAMANRIAQEFSNADDSSPHR